MRGIGKGQTIKYQLTTEIAQLIRRDLKDLGMEVAREIADSRNPEPHEIVLWLLSTQLQVEKLQQLTLSGACVGNVWRRRSLDDMLSLVHKFELDGTEKDGVSERNLSAKSAVSSMRSLGVGGSVGLRGGLSLGYGIAVDKECIPEEGKSPLCYFVSPFVTKEILADKIIADPAAKARLVKQASSTTLAITNSSTKASSRKSGKSGKDESATEDDATAADGKVLGAALNVEPSLMTSWLTLQCQDLTREEINCPSCGKAFPEHSDSCDMEEKEDEHDKNCPASYKVFPLFDGDKPILSAVTTMKGLIATHPDAISKAWYGATVDICSLFSYVTEDFRTQCMDMKVRDSLKGEKNRKKRTNRYYSLLASLESNIKYGDDDHLELFKNGKRKALLTKGALFASALKEDQAAKALLLQVEKNSGKSAVSTKAVKNTTHVLQLADSVEGRRLFDAVSVFTEEVLFPADGGADKSIRARLADMIAENRKKVTE